MKRLGFILVLVMLSLSGWTQGALHYFQWLDDYFANGYEDSGFNVYPSSDSSYIVYGVSADSVAGSGEATAYYRPYFMLLDEEGNVLAKKDYSRPFEYLVSIDNDLFIPSHDGGYAVAGFWQWWTPNNPTSFYGRYLLKLDANLDSAWIMLDSAYQIRGQFLNVNKLIQTPDHGYLLCGQNSYTHLTFTKVDSIGQLLWTKTMPYGSHFLWTANVLQDGNIFLVGQQGLYSYVGIIDPEANLLWDSTFNNVNLGFQNGSSGKPLQNGSFFIYDFLPGTDGQNDMHCMWWGPNRQLLKEKTISMPQQQYARTILELQDGSIVLAGKTGTDENPNIEHRAFLLKFWPNGEVHWLRMYHYSSTSLNLLEDCAVTPDGGFIVTGSSWETSSYQDTWILKLDSVGCPFPDCGPSLSAPPAVTEGNRIEVFPNPATDRLTVRSMERGLPEKAVLRLQGLDGKVMEEVILPLGFEELGFDITDFPAGLYLWEYLNEAGRREVGRFEVVR